MLEKQDYSGLYLLGDCGYPGGDYLMIPILVPTSEKEKNYNSSHVKTRNCFERDYKILK